MRPRATAAPIGPCPSPSATVAPSATGSPTEVPGGSASGLSRGASDFPEVRISAERLDIREFGASEAELVREVLQNGEWLPLSTALLETAGYPSGVDWWLTDAMPEPRRERTWLDRHKGR